MGHINLKLDDKLHDTVRELATQNRRSVTQEINHLLTVATAPPGIVFGPGFIPRKRYTRAHIARAKGEGE